MDKLSIEDYEHGYSELAQFCFRKLASLEARFVILCHRAAALGIETEDIMGVEFSAGEETPPLRVVN